MSSLVSRMQPDVAADPDPIAQGLAIAEHEIEPALAGAHDDCAGLVIAGIAHHGARHRGEYGKEMGKWIDRVVALRRGTAGRRRRGRTRGDECGRAKGAGEEAQTHDVAP